MGTNAAEFARFNKMQATLYYCGRRSQSSELCDDVLNFRDQVRGASSFAGGQSEKLIQQLVRMIG